MRILTIRQPWASYVIAGIKDVENRSWVTNFRGIIGIHAAKRMADIGDMERAERIARKAYSQEALSRAQSYLDIYGAIIGTVELADIIIDSVSVWADKGQNHWVISRPTIFERPIWVPGQRGLWFYEH